MKRCPQCNRTYTDDALSFCLDDGSPLGSVSAPSPSDSAPTIQYPPRRETTPQPTMVYQTAPAPPPRPAWGPGPMPQPQKRSVWPWIIGIGVVLMLMGIGVVVLIIAIASVTSNNNNNALANSNNSNWRANRNSNSNSSTTNANSSSSSLPTSFSDDFSSASWGSGSSQYGRTWYDDDEYHMHGTNNGFIVMYAPNATQYGTENATVRVTVRNVEAETTKKGYGLLVHADVTNKRLDDYGFLIDNSNKGYYRIVSHLDGKETDIVGWTAFSGIRTGTNSNQLEVRIRDRSMEFYINGQYVTSITDDQAFLRGKVGFYSSDTAETAFDDLEVSR